VSALAANSVSSEEQGAAAGTVTAAQGVGVVVGPMLGTFIYAFHATAPYVMVAVLLLAISVWVEQND
jgi:F0F1-type ATP synthase assembly protein I